jgi:hypothetical protein
VLGLDVGVDIRIELVILNMNCYFHGLITLLYSSQYTTELSLKHGFQLSLLTIGFFANTCLRPAYITK